MPRKKQQKGKAKAKKSGARAAKKKNPKSRKATLRVEGTQPTEAELDDLVNSITCPTPPSSTITQSDTTEETTAETIDSILVVPEIADDHGYTPLLTACQSGDIETVKALFTEETQPDINISEPSSGFTGLMLACMYGFLDICTFLLEQVPKPNLDGKSAERQNGETALMFASKFGELQIVSLLLQNGADAALQNCDGRTALMLACQGGHSEVVDVLLGHSAESVGTSDIRGMSALLHACDSRADNAHRAVESVLGSGRADLGDVDQDLRSALDMACRRGNAKSVQSIFKQPGYVPAKEVIQRLIEDCRYGCDDLKKCLTDKLPALDPTEGVA
eukprot:386797_1